MLCQNPGLIIKTTASLIMIDLLQTDDIGAFLLNGGNGSVKIVPSIAPPKPFLNIVAENPH